VPDRCPFTERCRFVVERCRNDHPPLLEVEARHEVRCIRAPELGIVPSRRVPAAPAIAGDQLAPVLEVDDLVCSYRGRHRLVAVDHVSLQVARGETLAVVGESGSGKSTLLRAIAGLHAPDEGLVRFHGTPLPSRAVRRSRETRRAIQLVFQNPDSSLNPRHTIATIIDRPLALFQPDLSRRQRHERIRRLLAEVRLDTGVLGRYPAQLSGGQKQRVALARAFAADPEVLLCDEVVSALDVSVQASILELLAALASEHGTAVLFVAHDLAVVRSIADRVCVMRSGAVREEAPRDEIFERPSDAYTRQLLAAVPKPARNAERPVEVAGS